jgi:hypothetical protein
MDARQSSGLRRAMGRPHPSTGNSRRIKNFGCNTVAIDWKVRPVDPANQRHAGERSRRRRASPFALSLVYATRVRFLSRAVAQSRSHSRDTTKLFGAITTSPLCRRANESTTPQKRV